MFVSSRPQYTRLMGASSHYGNRRRSIMRDIDRERAYREPVRTEEDPSVELLLCAADMATRGVEFPLTAAAEALELLGSIEALHAALSLREVGGLYGREWGAPTYVEAAYRLMEAL